jgi:hypothetical protein
MNNANERIDAHLKWFCIGFVRVNYRRQKRWSKRWPLVLRMRLSFLTCFRFRFRNDVRKERTSCLRRRLTFNLLPNLLRNDDRRDSLHVPASESIVVVIVAASIVILLDVAAIALHTDSTHTYVDHTMENLDAICKNKPNRSITCDQPCMNDSSACFRMHHDFL